MSSLLGTNNNIKSYEIKEVSLLNQEKKIIFQLELYIQPKNKK